MKRILTMIAFPLIALWLAPPNTAGIGSNRTLGTESLAGTTVTGTVSDALSGVPVPNAEVILEGTRLATISGWSGEFHLNVPADVRPSGGLVLRVEAAEYDPARVVLDEGDSAQRIDIRLRPAVAGEHLANPAVVRRVRAEALSIANLPPPPIAADVVGYAPSASLPPGWNREGYDHIEENRFLAVANHPRSTFAIDVDRASYSNIRRFILDGMRPPIDVVRIEEMINYFEYQYPVPGSGVPFGVGAEVGAAPWKPEHRLLRVAVASPPVDLEDLPPSNLVFLLDVSGSMMSANKLPLVKRSMRMLVDELRPQDRVAIVVYAGAAGLVLPSTTGQDRERILAAIDQLEAGGSTAGGAGLKLAYRVAQENYIENGTNRVILATDGDFNVGPSSDSEMIRLIEEMRDQGTFLTVLGFGTGNLQDAKMEKLANHGNGQYAYIDSLLEARKVLVREIGGTLMTVAKDVKLQIEFNPVHVAAYRLIGYENRLLATEDFNDDARDGGELGAGHTVTALYEIVPVDAHTNVDFGDVDPLRYSPNRNPSVTAPTSASASSSASTSTFPDSGAATRTTSARSSSELAFVRIRYKNPAGTESRLIEHPVPYADQLPTPSEDFRFASAVAAFGMLLRESEHRGAITIPEIIELARSGSGSDEHGDRSGFVRLVERFESMD